MTAHNTHTLRHLLIYTCVCLAHAHHCTYTHTLLNAQYVHTHACTYAHSLPQCHIWLLTFTSTHTAVLIKISMHRAWTTSIMCNAAIPYRLESEPTLPTPKKRQLRSVSENKVSRLLVFRDEQSPKQQTKVLTLNLPNKKKNKQRREKEKKEKFLTQTSAIWNKGKQHGNTKQKGLLNPT